MKGVLLELKRHFSGTRIVKREREKENKTKTRRYKTIKTKKRSNKKHTKGENVSFVESSQKTRIRKAFFPPPISKSLAPLPVFSLPFSPVFLSISILLIPSRESRGEKKEEKNNETQTIANNIAYFTIVPK